MLPSKYREFRNAVLKILNRDKIITDLLRRVAYGTDAGFYQLIPEIVLFVDGEEEVRDILAISLKLEIPVTFRAAGTSLSGQAISDSVLICLGKGWKQHRIFDNAHKIELEPGIIGGNANAILAPYERKLGPDPASIDTAKIGGILGNNASGMCCGVEQNSYQTLESMRIVLGDGSVVDTGDEASRNQFRQSHGGMLKDLANLRQRVLADQQLEERIRYKFKIKNTTGYSLNALLDFENPFDIMAHLMVGSEGTLGFISRAVYRTVVEHRHKASALILYPDVKTACRAIPTLQEQPVDAAELMDRAALRSVQDKEGMPEYLKDLGDTVTALLVETRAEDKKQLAAQIEQISQSLQQFPTIRPVEFTDLATEYTTFWKIRKGLFPAVGAVRQTGTTVIIEDVAFPGTHLADAALDLQNLFEKYNYSEAIIFGHALDGNLHFVFTQNFSSETEVIRYRDFMEEVVAMVVERYDGSLKAEHGTGRNMAPFVEKEWGEAAYGLMKEIKKIFDPGNLLNPGVIFNQDTEAHIKNLKPLPATHELVDKCIECGFCEPVCPSRNLTFTPRQRIAGRREISRRIASNTPNQQVKELTRAYTYPGKDTCAADSLCSTRCPVGIDTGKMIKELRREAAGSLANKVAARLGSNFKTVAGTIGTTLDVVDGIHKVVGTPLMDRASSFARGASGRRLPLWNREMPTGAGTIASAPIDKKNPLKVIYYPSCAGRAMGGPSRLESQRDTLPDKTKSLLQKAGYEVIYPPRLGQLCCGQAFESKGFFDEANRKASELSKALLECSENGAIPLLCDTSPCLYRMKSTVDTRLKLFEPIEFVLLFLMDRLKFTQRDVKVAIHPTCSTRKMGLEDKLLELAQACAREVVMPDGIYCCGFAGDRGFNFPELNESALAGLQAQVRGCEAGYSTSRTCEIGLALHGQIPYRSILYLVDEASTPIT